MRIRFRSLARRDEGQALVELSLCTGFLCLMLLAVWQVGSIFSNFIDISEAARSGARAAALSGAPTTTGDAPSLSAAIEEGKFAATNSVGCTYNSPPSPAVACPSVPGMNVTIEKVGIWTAGGQVKATVTAPYSLSLFGVSISNGTLSVSDFMRVHRQGA
jgi:hypothetical protein